MEKPCTFNFYDLPYIYHHFLISWCIPRDINEIMFFPSQGKFFHENLSPLGDEQALDLTFASLVMAPQLKDIDLSNIYRKSYIIFKMEIITNPSSCR